MLNSASISKELKEIATYMILDMKRYIQIILNKIIGTKNGKLERRTDWSELPPELLDLIAQKLSEVSDFVRFRAVCTKWRLSLQLFNSAYPRAFFPWIHFYHRRDTSDILSFNRLSIKLQSLPLPESYICYQHDSDGFLLFQEPTDESTLFIFNPLTRTKICLPSLSTLKIDYYVSTIHPVRLCPNRSGQCAFLLELKNDPQNCALVSCRVGDEHWTLASVPHRYNYFTFIDVLYKDEYLVSFQRNIEGIINYKSI